MDLQTQLHETIDFINKRFETDSKTAIVLGTGLGTLLDDRSIIASLPYSQIPHFHSSTAPTHLGRLVLVNIEGKEVWVLAGRMHYYEGYSMSQITYPIRVLAALGVENVLITNASGSISPMINASDIVLIEDHINLLPDNPLRGFQADKSNSRYVELLDAYNPDLISKFEEVASKENIDIKKGIYVAVQGPSLETRAEYRFMRMIGGDVVGMSSVPEVIVARQCGLNAALISVVSNQGYPQTESASLEQIVANVHRAVPHVITLLKHVVSSL